MPLIRSLTVFAALESTGLRTRLTGCVDVIGFETTEECINNSQRPYLLKFFVFVYYATISPLIWTTKKGGRRVFQGEFLMRRHWAVLKIEKEGLLQFGESIIK